MNHLQIGNLIAKKRKELGITQQAFADMLHISFQAVSKWENNSAYPDIQLLPSIASVLGLSMDALFGYSATPVTEYEQRYRQEEYYWGLEPNRLCYELLKLCPPVRPCHVLDIGCGEGKDAVFLAKCGYQVTALDSATTGLEKARHLAEMHHVSVNFFPADINDYTPGQDFDIIFSSGVLHYLRPSRREDFIKQLKLHTSMGGLHIFNVFVQKPFIPPAPDYEKAELQSGSWKSGELFTLYCDWKLRRIDEVIFDCNSSGIPHKHCMDIMIAERV